MPGHPVAVVAHFNKDVAPTAWLADGALRTVTDIGCEVDCLDVGGGGSSPGLSQRPDRLEIGNLDDGIFSDAVELELQVTDVRLPQLPNLSLNAWSSCREAGIVAFTT